MMRTRIISDFFFFFFNDTATTEIYPLPLHDALPISAARPPGQCWRTRARSRRPRGRGPEPGRRPRRHRCGRAFVRRGSGPGLDRHPGNRAGRIQAVRRAAARRQRGERAHLRLAAPARRLHHRAQDQVDIAPLPLIAHSSADAVIAYRAGVPILATQFLADLTRVAPLLGGGAHVLNACADRYRFAVGLAASLVSGKLSLLPSTHTPEVIRQLTAFAPDVICLTDEVDCDIDLPRVPFPGAAAAGSAQPAPVPAIDTAQLAARSEEHTSELQSPCNLVCRLLLEKKKYAVHIEV